VARIAAARAAPVSRLGCEHKPPPAGAPTGKDAAACAAHIALRRTALHARW
jgi:hypothetical protein